MTRNRLSLLALAAAPALASGILIGLFPTVVSAQGNPTSFSVKPPELVGARWLNTPKNEPLPLSSRKGKVTILHFWTFG